MDRAERAPQRRAQPERDLPRPDVVRRLHERADDLDAVLPVRLRRAVRRRDRGHRVAARSRARTCATAPLRVEAVGYADRRPAVVGPVRRPVDDGEPRRRASSCGSAPTCKPVRRADGAALRRLLVAHDVVARGARPVRRRRERPVHRRRRRASPATAAAAQHARRPALGRPAARLRLPARRRDADVGRGRRPPDRDAARGRRHRAPAAATPAAACSSCASRQPGRAARGLSAVRQSMAMRRELVEVVASVLPSDADSESRRL